MMKRFEEGQPLFVCEECGEFEPKVGKHLKCSCELTPVICHRCGEPLLSGEPRFTAGEYNGKYSHYECKKMDDDKLDRDLRNLRGKSREVGIMLADMRKRLKL